VRDDRARVPPRAVIVGQPGAARARRLSPGTPCRIKSRRTPRPAHRKQAASPPDLPAAQQATSTSSRSAEAPSRRAPISSAREGLREWRATSARRCDVDDDRLGLDQGRGEPGDRQLARRVQAAAGGEVALRGPDRESARRRPLEQAPVPQPRQSRRIVSSDTPNFRASSSAETASPGEARLGWPAALSAAFRAS